MDGNAAERSVTKTDFAFEHLRQAIYSGELLPGQRLPVSDLMKLLNISPTPIREALRLLQSSGLIVHEPHRGMIVRSQLVRDDRETDELRTALEPLAAAKAAENGTDAELDQIAELYKRMCALASRPSRSKTALSNIRGLHEALFAAIAGAAHYPVLAEFIDKLRRDVRESRPLHQWEETLDEQGAIVRAIVARDPSAASKAMRAYLTHVRNLATKLALQIARGA